jgi:hypothetical protein
MSHHLVKIKWSKKFVGSDLQDCDRDNAPLESLEEAQQRAQERFGKDWPKSAEVIKATPSDWCRHIARKPREMTNKRRRHLERLHADRYPLRRYTWQENGQVYYIFSRAAQKSEEMLAKAGVKVNWRTFMRRAKPIGKFPFRTENEPGVWVKRGKDWRKIV